MAWVEFSHGLPDASIRMWTKTVLVPGDINEGKLGGLFFMGSVEQLTSLCYDVNKGAAAKVQITENFRISFPMLFDSLVQKYFGKRLRVKKWVKQA